MRNPFGRKIQYVQETLFGIFDTKNKTSNLSRCDSYIVYMNTTLVQMSTCAKCESSRISHVCQEVQRWWWQLQLHWSQISQNLRHRDKSRRLYKRKISFSPFLASSSFFFFSSSSFFFFSSSSFFFLPASFFFFSSSSFFFFSSSSFFFFSSSFFFLSSSSFFFLSSSCAKIYIMTF